MRCETRTSRRSMLLCGDSTAMKPRTSRSCRETAGHSRAVAICRRGCKSRWRKGPQLAAPLNRMRSWKSSLSKPIIAAVHGYCLGHALATALLCDRLVAGTQHQVPGHGDEDRTPDAIAAAETGSCLHLANDVAMTGRMFSAEDAWSGGMLTRLAEDGGHISAAERAARAEPGRSGRPPSEESVPCAQNADQAGHGSVREITGDFDWANNARRKEPPSPPTSAVTARDGSRGPLCGRGETWLARQTGSS